MICSMNECTSCGCCSAVCPKQCIIMKTTEYGNRIPEINTEYCINCNLCQQKCPVLHETEQTDLLNPSVYMYQHYDEEILKQSASGGGFCALSDYTFEQKGIVFGAVWEKDFSVKFRKAGNRDELKAMQSSKYVQSYLELEIYLQIKEALNAGITVLFCGLPCQCAGIRSYLGRDYENFINVDLVCHGTAPAVFLQKHIQYLNAKKEAKIVSLNHTSKKRKWSRLIQRTIDYVNDDNSHTYLDRTQDFYLNNFLNHLFFNEACYGCKFASMPRGTDFTIGDFFGIGVLNKAKGLNHLGVSMMMVNTAKAEKISHKLDAFGRIEKRSIEEALYFNHNLWKPSDRNSKTEQFRKDFLTQEWAKIEEIYHTRDLKQKINVYIRKAIKKLLGDKMVCYFMYWAYKRKGLIKEADDIINRLKE